MWRPFFLALGITIIFLGMECLVVEKAIMADEFAKTVTPNADPYAYEPVVATKVKREFSPPEWAPWSLMSVGAVVVLYSMTLTKKTEE